MKALLKLFAAVIFMSLTLNASGQIKLDLKKKIENEVNRRANQGADKAINKSMDAVEGSVKEDAKKKENEEQGVADQNNQAENNGGNDDQNSVNQAAGQEQPTLQSFSKYDFVPGQKVIFYDDFSQDAVGDFPALWNTNGSAEVVTTNLLPGNWMKFDCREAIWTDNLLTLPENYTIEFDIIPIKGGEGSMSGYDFRLFQSINSKSIDWGAVPGKAGFSFTIEYYGTPRYRSYINGEEGDGLGLSGSKDGDEFKQKENQKYHIAIWAQKSRIRLYQDQNKLFDLPKAFPVSSVKMDRIRFENGAALVSNIRIAVGAPDTRNKLLTEGKLVSYGIYFDVNKDVVKPESYGTLKEIATVLQENPDVRIKITGHTDADGADAANLDLSKRRGASVKNELVRTFGIDASRIESDGLGESQPVAPNDNPSNKALNRRVEFVKL